MNLEEVRQREGQDYNNKQHDPWNEYHHYHIQQEEDNNQQKLNETILTLRLTKKHYKTAYTLAHLLGHKSLEDYVSHIVVQNLEMEINGGEINIDSKKLF
jgi:hypothetical protein